MREIKRLSPSGVSTFYKDPTEFYLRYCADHRPPRMPQTQPMSIGSAFDAFVKNYLVHMLHGSVAPEYEIETIFEAQVEEQHRDWAFENGEHVFNQYKASGALADLMIELEQASEEPQFEFTVERRIAHERFVDGIPLLGKPDVFFKTGTGGKVIIDWKVNGYCGKRMNSPKKGYLMCRDGWMPEVMGHSKTHGQQHKDCQPMFVDGVKINIAHYLEDIEKSWAAQTAIYLWLLGEDIGTKAIVGIDQLCGMGDLKSVRVATHRCRVSPAFQTHLMEEIEGVWTAVQTGHIFTDMTREQNDEKCAMLDRQYKAFEGEESKDKWFTSVMRQH